MCVCVLSVEIQTTGRILMKIGTEVVLKGEGSWGGGRWPGTPDPTVTGCVMGVRGATGASAVHFGANFINQKLQGAPDLKGAVTF